MHVYWVISDCPVHQFESIQTYLNNRYDADKSIKDVTRIMRLPGYNHTKTSLHYPCYVLNNTGIKYSLAEFTGAFGITKPVNRTNTGTDSQLSSCVSNVSSSLVDTKEISSSENRANLIKNILDGKDLHDSTMRLVSSSMEKFKSTPDEVTVEIQSLMNRSNAPRDRRFMDRFNDIARMAREWHEKQAMDDSTWLDVIELKKSLEPVEPLNLESLPNLFTPFILDVSERMRCPPDFTTVGMFITVASVIGRKIGIMPKQKDDWLVICNIWGVIIGRPSLMKTASLEAALKFIKAFEAEAKEAYQTELNNYQVKTEISELRSKQNKKLAKEFIENNDDIGAENILSANIDIQDLPSRKRYIVNDSTVEKIGELLNENTNGLLIFRDELSGFLNSLDKDKFSNDRPFYLESWDGKGNYSYDRIGRGNIDIESTTLSILGGIQPSKIKAYIYNSVNSTNSDDGLIQRFQLAVYPDTPKCYKLIDRYPDNNSKNKLAQRIREINDWSPNLEHSNKFDDNSSPALRYSPEAQVDLYNWINANEAICRDNQHPALESHFTKYKSLVPSISLIIELMDCDNLDNVKTISKVSLTKAIQYVEYLRSHAYRIYGMANSPEIENAITLKDHFDDLPNPFSVREVYRKCWIGLPDKESTLKALELLEDNHYCRSELVRHANTGKTQTIYHKHPKFIKDTN